MKKYQEEQMVKISNATQQSASVTKIVAIASVLIGVAIILYVRKLIIQPLVNVTTAVEVVAAGNLTTEDLNVNSKDEIGRLVLSVNKMKDNLRNLVANIQKNIEHLLASVEELSAST